MNLRIIFLSLIMLASVGIAEDLKLPSAGFDVGKVPPEGWQVFGSVLVDDAAVKHTPEKK